MEMNKDILDHLSDFIDDRTILNMLSVNKNFSDDKFFIRVLQKKYPFMLKYKRKDISWRKFYVQTIYYISKMKEMYPNEKIDSVDIEEMIETYKNVVIIAKGLQPYSNNVKLLFPNGAKISKNMLLILFNDWSKLYEVVLGVDNIKELENNLKNIMKNKNAKDISDEILTIF